MGWDEMDGINEIGWDGVIWDGWGRMSGME